MEWIQVKKKPAVIVPDVCEVKLFEQAHNKMPLYSHTLYLVRKEVKGILKFASQRKGEI